MTTDDLSPGARRMARAHQARTAAANVRKARDLWTRGWVAVPESLLAQMAPHSDGQGGIATAGPAMAEHLSQVDPCDGCPWCSGYVSALADLLKLHRTVLGVE